MIKLKVVFAIIIIDIKNVLMDVIPPDMIINYDHTAMNYVPVSSSWTMEKAGTKHVEIIGKDDKR